MKIDGCERNYLVSDISPRGTVLFEREGVEWDSGERPEHLGKWGMSEEELRILFGRADLGKP